MKFICIIFNLMNKIINILLNIFIFLNINKLKNTIDSFRSKNLSKIKERLRHHSSMHRQTSNHKHSKYLRHKTSIPEFAQIKEIDLEIEEGIYQVEFDDVINDVSMGPVIGDKSLEFEKTKEKPNSPTALILSSSNLDNEDSKITLENDEKNFGTCELNITQDPEDPVSISMEPIGSIDEEASLLADKMRENASELVVEVEVFKLIGKMDHLFRVKDKEDPIVMVQVSADTANPNMVTIKTEFEVVTVELDIADDDTDFLILNEFPFTGDLYGVLLQPQCNKNNQTLVLEIEQENLLMESNKKRGRKYKKKKRNNMKNQNISNGKHRRISTHQQDNSVKNEIKKMENKLKDLEGQVTKMKNEKY